MLPALPQLRSTKIAPSPSIKKKPLGPITSTPNAKQQGTLPSPLNAATKVNDKNIHSASYHQVLGDLEDRIGRSATHDEVAKELAIKLRKVTEKDRNAKDALDLLEANLERSQTELGDDVRQWKPDDYMHHEQLLKKPGYMQPDGKSRFARHPSNIRRAGTLSRVLVEQDPGLGNDFVTNGKQWQQPSMTDAKMQQKYTMFKGGEASVFALIL